MTIQQNGQGTGSTPLGERSNPVHVFSARLSGALDQVAGAAGWSMTPEEQAETLVELTRSATRLAELRLRVLAAADRSEVGPKQGAASTASWLAAATREERPRVHGDLRLARTLDDPAYAPTREALASGGVNLAQGWVIVRALEELHADRFADEITDEQWEQAQQHLVELAGEHDAKALRLLAGRIFELLAPAEADKREGEALEREERRARRKTSFAMRDNGDGTTNGWFKIPTAQAEMLSKALNAFAAPRRTAPEAWRDETGKKVPYRTLLGQAFCELIEHLPTDKLPQSGGVAATVVVTMELDRLTDGLGGASLDTGARISAGQARRLACTAGIIPAVLGGDSAVLDLGRTTRLFDRYQRTAMAQRDGGCTARGCDRPAAWCEAHHETPWSHGGHTNLDDGRLLCPRHHQMAHDGAYDMRRLPDGKVRFARRT